MIFNKTILKVFLNFFPNKLVTFDDIDLSWMNEKIKGKIKWKNNVYKKSMKNSKIHDDYLILQNVVSEVSDLISKSNGEYYNRLLARMNDP